MEYDVVIVGAGPAGSQCARDLCARGSMRVLLLEKMPVLGQPNKSTAGTFNDLIEEFGIPETVIMERIQKVHLQGPTVSCSFPMKGAVLDFSKLKKILAEDAKKKGCEIRLNQDVIGPVIDDGTVKGVWIRQDKKKTPVRAQIVVDATGPPAIIARGAGIRNPNEKMHGTLMEYQMHLKNPPRHMIRFFLDNSIAPGGYAWIFSAGKNTVKVGLCRNNLLFRKMDGSGNMKDQLERFIASRPELKHAQRKEIHAGDAYMESCQMIAPGLVCAGDSACTINPFAAEGIRPAMHSGKAAAKYIRDHIERGTSLQAYESWWKRYSWSWKYTRLVAYKIYTMSNPKIDRYVGKVSQLDKNTVLRMQNMRFGFGTMIRLLRVFF